jgi:hypothetical protein
MPSPLATNPYHIPTLQSTDPLQFTSTVLEPMIARMRRRETEAAAAEHQAHEEAKVSQQREERRSASMLLAREFFIELYGQAAMPTAMSAVERDHQSTQSGILSIPSRPGIPSPNINSNSQGGMRTLVGIRIRQKVNRSATIANLTTAWVFAKNLEGQRKSLRAAMPVQHLKRQKNNHGGRRIRALSQS